MDHLAAHSFYVIDIHLVYIHILQFLVIRIDEFPQVTQSIVVASMRLWLSKRVFPGKVSIFTSSFVRTNRAPVFFRPVYILSCYVSERWKQP